jgi:tRNA nucleotidyltransferase (CCA-adding enzyme)
LFLAVTVRQQAVDQKIKNFFTKWRLVQQKVPLPEMTELHITPQMAEYPKIAHEVFMLLLDGKLRSHTEIMKFLKPLAPPPPPPPPPPPAKRGRAAKAAAAAAAAGQGAAQATPATGTAKKKKGKGESATVPPPAPAAASAKSETTLSGKASKAEKGKPASKGSPAVTKIAANPAKKSLKPAAKKTAKKKH